MVSVPLDWSVFNLRHRQLLEAQADALRTLRPAGVGGSAWDGGRPAALEATWHERRGRVLGAQLRRVANDCGDPYLSLVAATALTGFRAAALLSSAVFGAVSADAAETSALLHAFIRVMDGLYDERADAYVAYRPSLRNLLRRDAWVAGGRAGRSPRLGDPAGDLMLDLAHDWIERVENAPRFRAGGDVTKAFVAAAARAWRAQDEPARVPRLLRSAIGLWLTGTVVACYAGPPVRATWSEYRRLITTFGVYAQWLDDAFDLGTDLDAGRENAVADALLGERSGAFGERPRRVSDALAGAALRGVVAERGRAHLERFVGVAKLAGAQDAVAELIASSVRALDDPGRSGFSSAPAESSLR